MNIDLKLIEKIEELKKLNLKIGLAHGVFDLLHVGHINYFKEAKNYVDYLFVSVTSDKFVNKGPGRPMFKINDRVNFLKNIKCVDNVIVSDDLSSEKIIKLIKPDYYFKGKDYIDYNDLTNNLKKETKLVEKLGGKVKYTNTPIYSSGKIINENFGLINEEALKLIKKINKERIKLNFIKSFKKKLDEKILVIGDPIIDIYKYVVTSGKSNKGTIISTLFNTEKKFAGGSLLVANTLAKFLKNVAIFDYKTLKEEGNYKLISNDIKKLKINVNYKPIKKVRYIDNYTNNKLYQVTYNEDQLLSKKDNEIYYQFLKKIIKKYKNIIILDYGYFSINEKVLKLINKSKKNIIINCQANSYNYGYNIFTKFKKSNLMCIDELEFRLGVKNKNENIEALFNKNSKIIDKFKIFIVTLGKNGCMIRYKKKNYFVSAVFKKALDTIGCGDIFVSLFSLMQISKRFDIIESALISHISAGIHANEYGNNLNINFLKLFRSIENVFK